MVLDINVMNSKEVAEAWRLGNNWSSGTSDVGLVEMCSSLNIHLGTGRVSLRTSSVLLNGAARAYQGKADELYKDCIKLNEEMIRRSKRPPTEIIDSDSDSTEDDSRKIHQNNNSNGNDSNRKRKNPYKQRNLSERSDLSNNLSHTDKKDTSKSSSTKEIGVQTKEPFISDRRKKYCPENRNIDENQPFGLVMVYDKKSRIPRKILHYKINV